MAALIRKVQLRSNPLSARRTHDRRVHHFRQTSLRTHDTKLSVSKDIQKSTGSPQTEHSGLQAISGAGTRCSALELPQPSNALRRNILGHSFPYTSALSLGQGSLCARLGVHDPVSASPNILKQRRAISSLSATCQPEARAADQAMPRILDDVESLRLCRREATHNGHIVGFVPTMGALHQGHLNLMREASIDCSEVWVSIYVNPTQFGANEDLSTYPSTWEADLKKIESLNNELLTKGHSRVTAIFRPRTPEVLYPYGVEATSHVIVNPELTQILEGSSRQTFFRGVTTVVMKLLNIVQPDRVYFGQKDIQQFAVIKRMIKEFHIPVHIQRVPTTREQSGLAMSSRNAYLGQRRLKAATLLHQMLVAAKTVFESLPPAERTRNVLLDAAMKVYNDAKEHNEAMAITNPKIAVQFRLDYLSLADPDNLKEIVDYIGPSGAIMSLAVYFEPLRQESIEEGEQLGINHDSTTVRLIDNELLGIE